MQGGAAALELTGGRGRVAGMNDEKADGADLERVLRDIATDRSATARDRVLRRVSANAEARGEGRSGRRAMALTLIASRRLATGGAAPTA